MRRGGDGWYSSQRSLRPVEHDEVMTDWPLYNGDRRQTKTVCQLDCARRFRHSELKRISSLGFDTDAGVGSHWGPPSRKK
ncbi:hypothetical protein EZV78_01860 [Cutibacterium avidum]|nr:hypothetical protein EZV78_01860 [Cutibacterium avidum]